jgi:peptidoglycan hydrolase-like protein with peptidoglycan-binding domain
MKRLLAAFLVFAALSSVRADDLTLAVQTKLTSLGYYDGQLDGNWGSQTAAAVRRFQVAKELRPTGELNAATTSALGIKQKPAAPQKTRAQALADIFVGGPYLTAPPAFQVQTVKGAQKNLKMLGFYSGPVDGTPTVALTDALRAYQRDHRFKTSGRLDKTTLQGLDLLTLPPEE